MAGAVASGTTVDAAYLTRGPGTIQTRTGDSVPDLPRVLAPDKNALLPFLALIAVLMSPPASAQEFCSEPVSPYCVDKDSEFDSVLQVNRCEDDLNDYEQQLNEYEQCISKQLESMRQALGDARKTLKAAKEQF